MTDYSTSVTGDANYCAYVHGWGEGRERKSVIGQKCEKYQYMWTMLGPQQIVILKFMVNLVKDVTG